MPWHIQITVALFMIVLYIAIYRELQVSLNFLDRQLFYSLGIGLFSTFLLIFWILQYSVHHTIIYWRIVELFK